MGVADSANYTSAMPALLFPNPDALRIVLVSRIVPPDVTDFPVRAGFDAHGRLWLEPHVPPSRDAINAMSRLGVRVGHGGVATESAGSWAELLPLHCLVAASQVSDAAGRRFLFELDDRHVVGFVRTLCRSPRPQFGVRWLPDGGRAWVSCTGPPVSVLLRAVEPDSHAEPFAEQAAGVWVRVGWEHPVPERLPTPGGRVLLLRPGRSVTRHGGPVPVPSGVQYVFGGPGGRWHDRGCPRQVPVRLGLKPARESPPGAVWVFPAGDAGFREFCRDGGERDVGRFEAACLSGGGGRWVVVRPASGAPADAHFPVSSAGYAADPRVAGLYLPAGSTIRPRIRPDRLARLFDVRPDCVTWVDHGPEGGIVARSVPVSAFRPVADSIEYVAPPVVRLATPPPRPDAFPLDQLTSDPAPDGRRHEQPEELAGRDQIKEAPPDQGDEAARPGWLARSLERLAGRLRRVEGGGVGSDRGRKGGGRAGGWADLAAVYAATGNPNDAAVCWVNAAWEADPPRPDWLEQWLVAECRAAKQPGPPVDLDRWLGEPDRPGAARVVAAYAAWAGNLSPPPAGLAAALPRVLPFLDRHFDDLPARAVWLARLAAARVCDGDALGLARWHDRVLARLRDQGPGLDLDEPSFLRFHGTASPDRFRTARDWLARGRKPILDWVAKLAPAGRLRWAGLDAETACTAAYAELTLAWGLGFLGERTKSRDWAARGRKVLDRAAGPGVDAGVHALLADLYQHRIRDVQDGRPGKAGLPPDLLARFDRLPPFSRHAVDRLRDHCRVLEPGGRGHAFRGADLREFRGYDRLGERLQVLVERADPASTAEEARGLLDLCAADPCSATVPRVTLTLLDLAPHLDAAAVERLLPHVVPACSWLETWLLAGRWADAERADCLPRYLARILGGAFAAAALTGAGPAARGVVEFLVRRTGTDPALRAAVDLAAGSLFRSLGKLGYRAEAETLLSVLDPGRGGRAADAPFPAARLGIAVGWLAVGDEDAGGRILDDARNRLFVARTGDDPERTDLAVAYAEALGFAPPRVALGRLEEIFQLLDRVAVTGSTNRYFTLKPLQLIDRVVRSVVTEDFALGPAVRGWLDDDEFLIRRRVHRDMADVLREQGIG